MAPPAPLVNTLSTSDRKTGWTAGFGTEYALGSSWSVKAEYLHVKLEDGSLIVPANATGFGGSVTVHQNVDLIRAGINYRFGGPMLARY